VRTVATNDDYKLLRCFVETNSQEAFRQLVDSHIDLVYSVCLRETRDPVLAQDVTQAVFLTLFHKAATIARGTLLTGWLFNTSRLTARNAMRQEARRKAVEEKFIAEQELVAQAKIAGGMSQCAAHTESWQAVEPLLNEAIASLGAKEREALLLRYFEDKSMKEIGLQLNTTENAAQMRVSRAVEKLKRYLRRSGVSVPLALLSTLLSQHALQAAPLMCAQEIGRLVLGMTGHAVESTAAVSASLTATKAHAISKGVMKIMLINQLKAASVIAALSVTVVAGVLSSRPSTSATSKTADSGISSENAQLCVQRLRQVALAVHQFLPAHDDRFPPQAEEYKRALLPYTGTAAIFVCPDDVRSRKRRVAESQSSYSFNRHLEGVSIKEIQDVAEVVMLYEGQNEKLDFRHGGRALVAFGDGHTEFLTRQQVKTLRWKP
jgi:RNA polymerase sigma factor (sigma-70 family)